MYIYNYVYIYVYIYIYNYIYIYMRSHFCCFKYVSNSNRPNFPSHRQGAGILRIRTAEPLGLVGAVLHRRLDLRHVTKIGWLVGDLEGVSPWKMNQLGSHLRGLFHRGFKDISWMTTFGRSHLETSSLKGHPIMIFFEIKGHRK